MIRPAGRFLVSLTAGILAAVTVVVGLAAWRLSSGPVSLSPLTPYIEDELSQNRSAIRVEFDDTVLRWAKGRPSLDISMLGARAYDETGALIAEVPEVTFAISGRALLRGMIAPTRIEVSGASATLVRRDDGGLQLGLADRPASEPDDQAGFIPVLVQALALPPDPSVPTGYIETIAVRDATLVFFDRPTQTLWRAPGTNILANRTNAGLAGSLSGTVGVAGQQWPIEITGSYTLATGIVDASVAFEDIDPPILATQVDELAELRRIRMPVTGRLGFRFSSDGIPQALALEVSADAGTVDLPELYPAPLTLDGLLFEAGYDLEQEVLSVAQIALLRGPVTLTGKGTVDFSGGEASIALDGGFRNTPVEDLVKLWPRPVGESAREWIAENLSDGHITHATYKARIPKGLVDEGPLPEKSLRIEFAYDGLTVNYLRPMPPIKGARGSGVITGATLDVSIEQGVILDELVVSDARLQIPDLHPKYKPSEITFVLTGATRRTLELLDHEPLRFTSRYGIDPEAIGGTAATRVRLNMLLRKELTLDEIEFAAASRLKSLSIDDVIGGRPLQDAEMVMRVNGAGVAAEGTGRIAGTDAQIAWEEDFAAPAGADTTRYRVAAMVEANVLAELGVPVTGVLKGPVPLQIETSGRGDTVSQGRVAADLTPTEVTLKAFNWKKPAGTTSALQFDFSRSVTGTRIDDLAFDAADASVKGWVGFKASGAIADAHFSPLTLGPRTDAKVSMSRIREDILAVDVTGASLDLSGLFDDLFSDDEEGVETAVELQAAIGRLYLSEAGALVDVEATGRLEDSRLMRLDLSGAFAEGGAAAVRLGPSGPGERALSVTADNAGAFLRAFDVYRSVNGGTMDMRAIVTEGNGTDKSTTRGNLEIAKFRVTDAPVLARILTVGSVSGVGDLLQGDGIAFEQLSIPFTIVDGLIVVEDGRVFGPALGLTLKGDMDTRANEVAVRGTLIPSYTLNTAVSQVPLLGEVLAGGEGEGVFALNYAVEGPMSDPDVSVNPLSALTPGILRRIFDVGGSGGRQAAREAEAATTEDAPSPGSDADMPTTPR